MAARILVVEDDPAILRGLELNLQIEGFETLSATDGERALELVPEADLVVLDLMLPRVHGYQVCQRIRASGNTIPIILLSARNAEMDIVMGLELGADDYVTKPFRAAELVARARAHLRRRQPKVDRWSFADVSIDVDRRLVTKAGEVVELTPREYELLVFLVQNEGRAVTRDQILQAVWGERYFGTDRTVDNFVTRLRQKLDAPGDPAHFLTVRGIGYRFVGEETS
jgi:two-component system alkaline phosphatase synthesis response regulator PhoP